MFFQKPLVALFRLIKGSGGSELCDDGVAEGPQFLNEAQGDEPLPFMRVKDGRTVLRADVRPLAVELRGVVYFEKEAAQRFKIRPRGVEGDAHGLCMAA